MRKIKLYENNKLNPNHFIARLILQFKKHFGESIFYSVELNKSYKFTSFFKKYWLLFVLLIVPVFIAIIAYVVIKSNEDIKIAESVSPFELISLLITYISSTLLGVVVYFHSWSQGKLEEKKKGISMTVRTVLECKDDVFCGCTQDDIDEFFDSCRVGFLGLNPANCNFIEFILNNMNHNSPLKVEFESLFYLNEMNEVEELQTSIITDYDEISDMLEFNKPKTFFVGIDNEILSDKILFKRALVRFFVLFKISNLDGHESYCLCETFIMSNGETFSDEFTLLSIGEYGRLIDKYGVGIIKDISMNDMINGRIYKNIDLYL